MVDKMIIEHNNSKDEKTGYTYLFPAIQTVTIDELASLQKTFAPVGSGQTRHSAIICGLLQQIIDDKISRREY